MQWPDAPTWLALAYAALVLVPRDRKQRLLNIVIGLDQFLWVLITLGNGHPDETISAALWRMETQGKLAGRMFRPVIDLLFLPLERDHCRASFYAELRGQHLPGAYRANDGGADV